MGEVGDYFHIVRQFKTVRIGFDVLSSNGPVIEGVAIVGRSVQLDRRTFGEGAGAGDGTSSLGIHGDTDSIRVDSLFQEVGGDFHGFSHGVRHGDHLVVDGEVDELVSLGRGSSDGDLVAIVVVRTFRIDGVGSGFSWVDSNGDFIFQLVEVGDDHDVGFLALDDIRHGDHLAVDGEVVELPAFVGGGVHVDFGTEVEGAFLSEDSGTGSFVGDGDGDGVLDMGEVGNDSNRSVFTSNGIRHFDYLAVDSEVIELPAFVDGGVHVDFASKIEGDFLSEDSGTGSFVGDGDGDGVLDMGEVGNDSNRSVFTSNGIRHFDYLAVDSEVIELPALVGGGVHVDFGTEVEGFFLNDDSGTGGFVGDGDGDGVLDVGEVGDDHDVGFLALDDIRHGDHLAVDGEVVELPAFVGGGVHVDFGTEVEVAFLSEDSGTGGFVGDGDGDGVLDMREVGGDGSRANNGIGVYAICFDHFAKPCSNGPASKLVSRILGIGQSDDIVVVVGACCGTSGTGSFVRDGDGNGVFALDKVGHDLIVLVNACDGVNVSFCLNGIAVDSPAG